MALILAVANEKGGCGKTSTAMNLAGGLHRAGYRVLVVDVDPQASATLWALALGQESLPFQVLTRRQLKGSFRQFVDSPDYDVVLADCQPGVVDLSNTSGRLTRDAIVEADAILVPLRPTRVDFNSAARFVRFLATIQPTGQRVLVVINGKRNTVLSRDSAASAAALFADLPGSHVLATAIGFRESIAEVSGSGQTIFQYAPRSTAAQEYSQLTQEIIQCLAAAPPSPPSSNPTS